MALAKASSHSHHFQSAVALSSCTCLFVVWLRCSAADKRWLQHEPGRSPWEERRRLKKYDAPLNHRVPLMSCCAASKAPLSCFQCIRHIPKLHVKCAAGSLAYAFSPNCNFMAGMIVCASVSVHLYVNIFTDKSHGARVGVSSKTWLTKFVKVVKVKSMPLFPVISLNRGHSPTEQSYWWEQLIRLWEVTTDWSSPSQMIPALPTHAQRILPSVH